MEDFYQTIVEINNEEIPYYLKFPRIRFLNELSLPNDKLELLINIFKTKFYWDTPRYYSSISYYNFEEELIKHTYSNFSLDYVINNKTINYIPILSINVWDLRAKSVEVESILSERAEPMQISLLRVILSNNAQENYLDPILNNSMIKVSQLSIEFSDNKAKNSDSITAHIIWNVKDLSISKSLTNSIRILYWKLSTDTVVQEFNSFSLLVQKLANLYINTTPQVKEL